MEEVHPVLVFLVFLIQMASSAVPPTLSFRDRMVSSSYAFRYADIATKPMDRRKLLKNMLREINQKRILQSRQSQALRKGLRVAGTSEYRCPGCEKQVRQLTNAHVGPSVASMIDAILAEDPAEEDAIILYKKLEVQHAETVLVLCCHACNKRLEDTEDD